MAEFTVRRLKILKNKLKHSILAFGLAGLSAGAPMMQGCSDNAAKEKITAVKDSTTNVREINEPVATISYRTDTLYRATSTLLFHMNGKITRYYVENNNSFRMQLPYFVHEDWHHHNHLSNFRTKSKLSPYEYYKLCIQDEITANLAAILTARYEYLAAENKKAVISKYENSYMKFYFNAIKDGTILPTSKGISDEEKKLLANGVSQMWMETYYPNYASRLFRMIPRYIERRGLYKSNLKQYQNYVKYMWTIGGVDFSKFLDGGIEAREDEKIIIADDMKNIPAFSKDALLLVQNVTAAVPYLKNFAPQDQDAAFQHIAVAAKLKSLIKNLDDYNLKNNPKLITAAYNKAMYELTRDTGFISFVDKYAFVSRKRFNPLKVTENSEEKLKKIYSYKGVDLCAMIKDFDLKNVPVSRDNFENTSLKFYFCTDFESHIIKTPYQPISEKAQKESPTRSAVLMAGATSDEGQKAQKKRLSDIQYIDIPNFWQPILTEIPQQQHEAVLDCVSRFEAVDAVLKGCDSKSIRKYRSEHAVDNFIFSKSKKAIR